jgi:hypothetical protein
MLYENKASKETKNPSHFARRREKYKRIFSDVEGILKRLVTYFVMKG